MSAERKTLSWIFVAGFLLLLASLIFFVPFQSTSSFKAEGGSGAPEVTVVTSGTFMSYMTSVNQQGQTVIYGVTTTGTYSYATTSQATSQATTAQATTAQATTTYVTTTAPSSWLTITIQGLFKLLDPNGNIITTQTYELVTETSGAAADSLALDLKYDAQGVGIDWSSMTVDCSTSAAAGQPAAANPNQIEMVNQIPTLKAWSGMVSKTGQLTHTAKINDITGGKPWDHTRKLATTLAVACRATAKILPGFTLTGGGTEITATVGPVLAQTWLKWKEPPAPTPIVPTAAPEERHNYYAPTPAPTPTPQPTPTPTPDPTPPPKTCTALGCPTPLKTTGQTQPSPSLIAERKLYGWQLVGFPMPLIQIFAPLGTTIESAGVETVIVFSFAIAIVGIAGIFISNKRARRRLRDIF